MSEYIIKAVTLQTRAFFARSRRASWLDRYIERFWTLTDFEYGASLALVLIFLQIGLIRIACVTASATCEKRD